MPNHWELTLDHPYTTFLPVYRKRFYKKTRTGSGNVYLFNGESFTYVLDFGSNNELSHTGSFYQNSSVYDLTTAQAALDQLIPRLINV